MGTSWIWHCFLGLVAELSVINIPLTFAKPSFCVTFSVLFNNPCRSVCKLCAMLDAQRNTCEKPEGNEKFTKQENHTLSLHLNVIIL